MAISHITRWCKGCQATVYFYLTVEGFYLLGVTYNVYKCSSCDTVWWQDVKHRVFV